MKVKSKIDGLFFKATCEITSRKDLTANDKLLYCFIANYWKNKSPFNAGTDFICRCLGMSRASVFRSLDNLEKKRLIEVATYKPTGCNPLREIYQYGSRTNKNGAFIKQESINDLFKKVIK